MSDAVSSRVRREQRTVETMISLYCRRKHRSRNAAGGDILCDDCKALADYATGRLTRCRIKRERGCTCQQCPVHCYSSDMRHRIREVMRTAGPLMLFMHPAMTLRHWADSLAYRLKKK